MKPILKRFTSFLPIFTVLVGCSTGNVKETKGISLHGDAGDGYRSAINGVLMAKDLYACDWSGHESDNEPGCAYKEGQAAAEDADCHEDHEDTES